MNILFIGDIVGSLGRKALDEKLATVRRDHNINFVVANGENITHGKGINERMYKWLMASGVNVVTMGNHTFDNRDIFDFIDDAENLIVPINYEPGVPGKGIKTINYNGTTISVISLMGTVFMQGPLQNPFHIIDQVLEHVKSDVIIVDFHAEATSEKIAMGLYLDGRVTAVLGTHTHIPTADLRILPKGTAYQTDVGMNGPLNGVIGTKPKEVIDRFKTGLPNRYQVEESGDIQFNAAVISLNGNKVTKVVQINDIIKQYI